MLATAAAHAVTPAVAAAFVLVVAVTATVESIEPVPITVAEQL